MTVNTRAAASTCICVSTGDAIARLSTARSKVPHIASPLCTLNSIESIGTLSCRLPTALLSRDRQ